MRRLTASHVVTDGWLLGLVACVVYASIASPCIVDGDNAEFATLGAVGGRAHPSGYPLYVLWLRVWSVLPGSAAYHAALATALLGALTLVVLQAACRAWGAGRLGATAAVAMFGAAPLILRYHSEAEVFALNNLVVALILWLAASGGPVRGIARAAALGLVAGSGLSNHLTCVLLAPVGILGVVRAVRESGAYACAAALVALLVGLTPYVYAFFADGPASWGEMQTLSDVVAMITRRDYGVVSLMAGGAEVAWRDDMAALASSIARSWLWLPALAGVAMLGVRVVRPAGEGRAGWCALAASFVLGGPVLLGRFNIVPDGIGLEICQRFHVLPILLLAIPVSAALDVACTRIARQRVALVLCAMGFVVLALLGLPKLAALRSPAVELGMRNVLRSLPARSIAVLTADDQCFGARYAQLVLGDRPDVAVICPGLIPLPDYRAMWSRRGIVMPPSSGPSLGLALLATGRPVIIDQLLTRITSAFPSYPFGVHVRILPPGASPPTASEVDAINRDIYAAFALDYAYPRLEDGYPAVMHHRYAATWAAIARLLDRSGDRDAARAAYQVTRQLQPSE